MSDLNGLYESIQFIVEKEQDVQLPFLDILIKSGQIKLLSCTVYRKQTRTNVYLNSWSHHPPAQKQGVILTLLERAYQIADLEHLEEKQVFLKNGYTLQEIKVLLPAMIIKGKGEQIWKRRRIRNRE